MNKKKLLLPVVFLAAALAGFAALKATRPEQPVAPPKEPVWRVSVMTVAPGSHSAILTLNGKVESPEFTQAAAPGMGRVVRLPAREGQPV